MTSLRYKVIILDFDGVLVESNGIKDKAFEMVFADYPEHLQAILEYHQRTARIRFEKFRHIYEHILRLPYTPAMEQALSEQFSRYCIDAVVHCPWVAGAREFLAYFDGKLPLYIVSINPKEDLAVILKKFGIEGLFKGVYTVESSKVQAIQDICHREGIGPKEAVFIGDARSDYESAMGAKVDFIGRRSNKNFNIDGAIVFDDLNQIHHYLTGVYHG